MADTVATTARQVSKLSVGDSPKTVLDSATDFTVVHPLSHKWTLWYTKPPTGEEDWRDLLKELVTVGTVEEFWGAYNSIPKVSELPRRADYAIFRKGVRPEWEDPANAKGGKWIYQHKGRPDQVDDKWLKVLLGIVGDTLDDTEEEQVNGVFAMVRPNAVKIALWVSKGADATKEVAIRFKNLLEIGKSHVEFSPHDSRPRRGPNSVYV